MSNISQTRRQALFLEAGVKGYLQQIEQPPASNPGYEYSKPIVKRMKMFLPDGTYGDGPVVVEQDAGAIIHFASFGK